MAAQRIDRSLSENQEPTIDQDTREATSAADFADVQSTAAPLRIGELTNSEGRPDWLIYRYHHPMKSFEISFPRSQWRVAEHSITMGEDSVVTLLELIPQPQGFTRIVVHLDGPDDGVPFGSRYFLEKALEQTSPIPAPIPGEPLAVVFTNVEIYDVDGGIPINGNVFYFPHHDILVRVAERSSYASDNVNPELIDTTAVREVLSTFRLLPVSLQE